MKGLFHFLFKNRPGGVFIPSRPGLSRQEGAFRGRAGLLRASLTMQYSPDLLAAVTLIVGLNVLDAFFTLIVLEEGGSEVNPLVQSALDAWGNRFWIWKFVMVSSNVVLLCLCSHLRYVKAFIVGICLLYTAVVMYQVVFLNLR
jgi:hypothetical protein